MLTLKKLFNIIVCMKITLQLYSFKTMWINSINPLMIILKIIGILFIIVISSLMIYHKLIDLTCFDFLNLNNDYLLKMFILHTPLLNKINIQQQSKPLNKGPIFKYDYKDIISTIIIIFLMGVFVYEFIYKANLINSIVLLLSGIIIFLLFYFISNYFEFSDNIVIGIIQRFCIFIFVIFLLFILSCLFHFLFLSDVYCDSGKNNYSSYLDSRIVITTTIVTTTTESAIINNEGITDLIKKSSEATSTTEPNKVTRIYNDVINSPLELNDDLTSLDVLLNSLLALNILEILLFIILFLIVFNKFCYKFNSDIIKKSIR